MTSLSLSPEIEAICRRVMSFEKPQQAISNPARFLAYVMTHGDYADMVVIQKHMTDDEICAAMDNAPPGIFDPRSWAYWNLKLGRYPAPTRPEPFFDLTNERRPSFGGEFEFGFDENEFPR